MEEKSVQLYRQYKFCLLRRKMFITYTYSNSNSIKFFLSEKIIWTFFEKSGHTEQNRQNPKRNRPEPKTAKVNPTQTDLQ